MPRGLKLASSCWRMSALSRSVRPPPKQLLSYFRSRRRRPAPQCPEATRRHLWEAAGGNGDLAKPRREAESTAPPTGGPCWSGQRPVTKAVNGTRRLGVLFGSSQEGPGGSPTPGQVGLRAELSGQSRAPRVGDASCRLWRRPPAATPRSSVTSGVKSDPDARAAFCAVRSVPVVVTFQARFGCKRGRRGAGPAWRFRSARGPGPGARRVLPEGSANPVTRGWNVAFTGTIK